MNANIYINKFAFICIKLAFIRVQNVLFNSLMGKLRFTKNELKRQREALQRYSRYLPTLILKKQQLRSSISKIEHAIKGIRTKMEELERSVDEWVAVFAEDVGFNQLLKADHLKISPGNVAGVDIPLYQEIEFEEKEYDLLTTPLWVDAAIEVTKQIVTLQAQLLVYQQQRDLLREELRITTQRVNLFEKIKIPQAQENIRIIRIYLGDLQTAEVVRGKIAKAKIEKKKVGIQS